MPPARRFKVVFCVFFAIVGVIAVFALLPTIVFISVRDDGADAESNSFIGFESALALYRRLDAIEHKPLQLEESMMNLDADPCEDPVDYWCGGWTKRSGAYRKIHPISFSQAQQQSVAAISTIVSLELERTWDPSPVARFHLGCTRTRTDPSVWGEDSPIFRQLLDDIRHKPWNGDTMAELFGRLIAVGADVPLSMSPMPNPTDTINGGWVIRLVPGGIIDGGDFGTTADSSTELFHIKNVLPTMLEGYRRKMLSVWKHMGKATSTIRQYANDATEVMRMLASFYVHDERSSCWQQQTVDEAAFWASYFENRECWQHDIWNASELKSLGHPAFNWSLLFQYVGITRLELVKWIWLPSGNRWVHSVTNPMMVKEQQWRLYLETSLRFAAGQQMASEWSDTKGLMGATSVIAHGSRHRGWNTDEFGTQTRRTRHHKHWNLHLSRLHDSVQSWLQVPIGSFSSKNGIETLSPELCTELTFVHLQPLLEQYYIEALGIGEPEVRQQIGDLIGAGVEQFKRLIREETPSWTSSTRKFFADKLDNLLIAIGSPPYQALAGATFSRAIFDNAFPGLSVMPNSFVENSFHVRQRRIAQMWALSTEPRLGTPLEDMPTYEINAYYDPTLNSVTLLAGILQAPFFSLNVVDQELLYSRMLSIIGHELGHAVDPSGRWTDWSGSVVSSNFWNQASKSLDVAAFAETEQCLIELYDNAVSANGNHDNGEHTLGENLADVIGLRIGYETLMRSIVEPGRQREAAKKFFGGWAQSWCARLSGAEEVNALKKDVHSLHEFRIAVPFSNMPEFSAAFKCSTAARMSRATSCDFFH